MDNKHYVLTERDRRLLDNQHREAAAAPPPAMLPSSSHQYTKAPDVYWALPPCETGFPAATRNSDGSITPGVAVCCLYRSDTEQDKLAPVLDAVGLPFRIVVKNHYMRVGNDFVQVWRHKNGTWSNERPELVVESTATTTTTGGPVVVNPVCRGDCLWVAELNGSGQPVWKSTPLGGCANTTTSTTTTTTTTTTTGTTVTTTTTTPQPDPCSSTPCRLRCVAATTTSPPGGTTSWPPQPSTGFVYQAIGTTCSPACKCFGAGDPCYLLNGEIDSRCVYVTTTTAGPTTTTTTGGPISGPQTCNIANTLLGSPAAGTYRTATLKGLATGWIVCQDCPDGEFPLFPRGSKDLIDPDPNGPVIVHDSPCGRSPCALNAVLYTEGKAVYRAFSLNDQQWFWGNKSGSDQIIQYNYEKWLANWQVCQPCGSGLRPANPPSPWLFYDAARNQNGISLNQSDGMYLYETSCVAGPSCGACELSHVGNMLGTTTSTTSPPTPRPTSTQPPCGCEPPTYCPAASGECVRTLCKPGGAATGAPACPTTTTGPDQCWNWRTGRMCVCGSTTTTTTTTTTRTPANCGGNCSSIWTNKGGPIGVGGDVPIATCPPGCNCNGTLPPGAAYHPCGTIISGTCVPYVSTTEYPNTCSSCLGTCTWYAAYSSGYGSALVWINIPQSSRCFPYPSLCSCADGEYPEDNDSGYGGCCRCSTPQTPPTSICDILDTPCTFTPPVGTECECCTTEPCEKYCSFKGNGTGGWTKIDDPCPTTCPCPAYPPTASGSDCDLRRYACGSIVPTTPTPPTTTGTTTSTTTPGPGACCYGDGTCSFGPYSWCRGVAVFQGAGVTCASVTCPQTTTSNPVGSCCVGSGGTGVGSTCVGNVLRSYCDYLNGQFHATPCSSLPSSAACYSASTTTTTASTGRCCYGVIGEPSTISCFAGVVASACAPPFLNPATQWYYFTAGATCGPSGSTGCSYPLTTTSTTTTTPAPPCAGAECTYQSLDGSTWTLMEACASPCNCPTPESPPAFEGDVATLNCVSP